VEEDLEVPVVEVVLDEVEGFAGSLVVGGCSRIFVREDEEGDGGCSTARHAAVRRLGSSSEKR
jgi:hypothetical protein